MLYNESEEPYLACSHMENMSSSKTYIWMITVWLLHTVNTIFSAGIWVDHLGFAWGDTWTSSPKLYRSSSGLKQHSHWHQLFYFMAECREDGCPTWCLRTDSSCHEIIRMCLCVTRQLLTWNASAYKENHTVTQPVTFLYLYFVKDHALNFAGR